ncbi:5-(carboxyamino)imidazole ribonucleotide mutase [Weissella halotolerans]|uniref:N5-carboxyaminoimidazole ribonucleotide mutase n=1 Tax=Weissella halotolerans DSM 20190 TaxID=1123500 RepID=A0A0R2G7U2_9LACO|nr:5-(carboxyamino)imidazole ribonucleotide mutase [Weissella halotolerans]KRN33226.1 phosphoribosylaminoimidazole carboxylase catalytic subunit [Weissella halotolerans DSM 20190]
MARVAVVMGSQSDWPTMRVTTEVLSDLGIDYETAIISAHRTPDRLAAYAKAAEQNNIAVIIAGAGGAAHLPGMLAANTVVPVIGVPIESKALHGLDSLLSIVQMPAGVPVATVAIGQAGAKNAAYLAAQQLAIQDKALQKRLQRARQMAAEAVVASQEVLNG